MDQDQRRLRDDIARALLGPTGTARLRQSLEERGISGAPALQLVYTGLSGDDATLRANLTRMLDRDIAESPPEQRVRVRGDSYGFMPAETLGHEAQRKLSELQEAAASGAVEQGPQLDRKVLAIIVPELEQDTVESLDDDEVAEASGFIMWEMLRLDWAAGRLSRTD